MATYSKIQRSFWETDEARDMTPEEKYFWLYLQTNANVNTLGCYHFRMRKAQDETGYNRETIEKLLQRMVETGRIVYNRITGEVFLLGWDKVYWTRDTTVKRSIQRDLKEVTDPGLKKAMEDLIEQSGIFKEKDGKRQKQTEKDNPDNFSEEEEEEEEEEEKKSLKEKRSKRIFTPPTLQEVEAYCRERRNRVDPSRFVDFYEAKGWMVGKNRMKDWKAAVRTWERQDAETAGQKGAPAQGAAAGNNDLSRRLERLGGA